MEDDDLKKKNLQPVQRCPLVSLGSELDIVPGQASTNLYLWMEQKTGKVIEGDQPLKYYVKMVSDGLCLFVLILLLKDNPCGAAAKKQLIPNWAIGG